MIFLPARTIIRPPVLADLTAILELNQQNRDFCAPFGAPPLTEIEVRAYIERSNGEDYQGYLIFEPASGVLIGVANLSQIFRRSFQNAYLGYYGSARFAGQGLMTDGVRQVVNEAFTTLQLHRVEANVQPDNVASRRLVQRLGFVKEGFSRRYLNIGGMWRDHERWAITVEDWPGMGEEGTVS